jgi:hypothetical protein
MCSVMKCQLFCQQASSGSAHFVDDAVVEVNPAAQWEDTSSCSEGREDTSPSSPEPVSGSARKLRFCFEVS